MKERIIYNQCPVCSSMDISEALQVKDYTVSSEIFSICQCNNCTVRFTQNIPSKENIDKYYRSAGYISHSDTKKGFVNRMYHFVRNYTLQAKRKLVQKESGLQKGNLLDIGAGTGAFAAVMQRNGWDITGLEPDETARKNALQNYELHLATPESLFRLPVNNFDAITLWHVLEHVHELHRYLDVFNKILKSSGKIFIAVPNYTSYDAVVYKIFWAAYDVPRHLYHFSPQSMQQLVQQHDFEIVKHTPMWFDSFYVAMLSEKYKTGKNNLLKALWNGLLSNMKALNGNKKCSSIIYILKKKQERLQ